MSVAISNDTVSRGLAFLTLRHDAEQPVAWRRTLILAAGLAAAYAIQAVVAYAWTSATDGLSAIWLGNGILAAALLLLPGRVAWPLFVLVGAMNVALALYVGNVPLAPALLVVAVGQAETVIAAVLVRVTGGGVDPTRLRRMLAMLMLAIVPATVVAATAGAALMRTMDPSTPSDIWAIWLMGDLMGMTLSLPATLILARPNRYRLAAGLRDLTNIGLMVGVIGLTLAICFLPTPRGASLLIVVAAFLASVRLPAGLVMLLNLAIVIIATYATMMNLGVTGRWPGSQLNDFLLLQLMLLPIVTCTLVTSATISDRARQERHMRRALNAARNARNRALHSDGVKARFLAAISHEMRTPLNSIMGHSELLDRASSLALGEARRVQAIRDASETLSQLIDDVLDFTQIDTGRIEMRRDTLDLTSLCRGALMGAQVLADGKPIDFHLEIAPDAAAPRIGDTRRLQQVLRQLLGNAVKFTPFGTITLEVQVEGSNVTFAVRDTGVGIDASELSRVFLPFSQVDETSKRRFGGAGLGLAIARGIVDAMGGVAGVESQFGKGSRFWFRVPLEQVHRSASIASVVCLPAADAPARALVVDDHPVNRDLAATFMQALGFEVVCAEDGRQAVDAMKSGWFDIVLMDLHMPVMDGLEATREIRGLPGARGLTPIVALTASACDETVGDCLRAGMNSHLAKPIRGEALAGALQAALAA
jgi:signal transduction histidine kinase/ActR/RegA family two-component response regulator